MGAPVDSFTDRDPILLLLSGPSLILYVYILPVTYNRSLLDAVFILWQEPEKSFDFLSW